MAPTRSRPGLFYSSRRAVTLLRVAQPSVAGDWPGLSRADRHLPCGMGANMTRKVQHLVYRAIQFALAALLLSQSSGALQGDGAEPLSFTVRAEPVFKELSPNYCWFHPRLAPLP